MENVTNSKGEILNPDTFGEWKRVNSLTYLFGNELPWERDFFKDWQCNTKFWTSGIVSECNGTKLSSLVWCSSYNFYFDENIWHLNETQSNVIEICCYARCIGQRYRKILDKSLDTQNLYRFVEDQLSNSDTDLQVLYKTLTACSYQSKKWMAKTKN
ncbi:Hypothetical predicted protein [Cloeon dipterum]|uniref:Uncharacterized protein n=1 Tax=Cloeon dipterum TaxID=197152 RepID=A0A8S1BUN4_9INSE|nr:Hypothetical predicted protein [Cloeon dipterum]